MTPDMNRRYAIAVYMFLLAISIILFLVSLIFFSGDDPSRAFLLNLSTELFGVVLVFFIVDQLFLVKNENKILHEISRWRAELLSNLNTIQVGIQHRFSPLTDYEEAKKEFNFAEMLQNADSVDILGNNLYNTLRQYRKELVNAILAGAKVRIIMVKQDGDAAKLMMNNLRPDKAKTMHSEWDTATRYLYRIKEEARSSIQGSFEFKLLNWLPSYSLAAFHLRDGHRRVRVTINPVYYTSSHNGRRVL